MVVIENPQTGETQIIEPGKGAMPPPPWRVKNSVANLERDHVRAEKMARFTRIASDFGLPTHVFQRVGGWLLGCAVCTSTAEVTELYDEGKITKEQHGDLFVRVANAIDQR